MLMYRLMLINEKICEIILMVITKVFNFFKRIIKAKLYGKAENYEEEIPKSEPDMTESEEDDIPEAEAEEEAPVRFGIAVSKQIEFDSINQERIKECLIAFDVETTGLSAYSDRIIEIGAVIFQNGVVHKTFSSLVNPGIPISQSASAINHITNEMLASAPSEKEIYPQLIDFLGDALCGKTVMCAHNAKFDFEFLCNSLSRLGFDANIEYVDTLGLSRRYLRGLENYKQSTLENYFGLINTSAHRAASDAGNCGKVLFRLLDVEAERIEAEKKQIEQSKPNQQELEVCAYIQNIISQRGGDTKQLRFKKNKSGYVNLYCLYNFLKFKFAKKGNYIIIESNCPGTTNYITEACTQSEGGVDYLRVYFSSPFVLEALSSYIYDAFVKCYKSMKEYVAYSDYRKQELENSVRLMCALSDTEVQSLLDSARERDYAPISVKEINKSMISREDVVINAINNRVPLKEISNAENWEKGFNVGFPYWEKGEAERKNGNIELAVELFDKARQNGYVAPALYNSYALAYRQLKDYSNEISILDEGISRMPEHFGEWDARRDKAIKLLYAQQEQERNSIKTVKQKEEKIPAKPRGRAVIQMDENGNVIKEFETVAAAAQEVGVNAKGIRDAANGIQKRAGGYCWKYNS